MRKYILFCGEVVANPSKFALKGDAFLVIGHTRIGVKGCSALRVGVVVIVLNTRQYQLLW